MAFFFWSMLILLYIWCTPAVRTHPYLPFILLSTSEVLRQGEETFVWSDVPTEHKTQHNQIKWENKMIPTLKWQKPQWLHTNIVLLHFLVTLKNNSSPEWVWGSVQDTWCSKFQAVRDFTTWTIKTSQIFSVKKLYLEVVTAWTCISITFLERNTCFLYRILLQWMYIVTHCCETFHCH